jgi:hypothetical protein
MPQHGFVLNDPWNTDGEAMILEEPAMDVPPVMGEGRERRVSVRAYNYWASLLAGRDFPSVSDLNANDISGFRDSSILLDFTLSAEKPVLRYIGKGLRDESGLSTTEIAPEEVPGRSLLSRLTSHYLEIIANRAPIGFEAEFVNTRGKLTMYRGILLPLSDDGQNINFIYGVISWKEEASNAETADARMALEKSASKPIQNVDDIFDLSKKPAPVVANTAEEDSADDDALDLVETADADDDALELTEADAAEAHSADSEMPDDVLALTDVDQSDVDHEDAALELVEEAPADTADDVLDLGAPEVAPELAQELSPLPADDDLDSADILDLSSEPVHAPEPTLAQIDEDAVTRLADRLSAARDAAEQIKTADSRTRSALYDALAEALSFHEEAAADPVSFAVLLDDAGLKMQDRAPFTPTVKMIFGVDYDKTRLTEYAAALSYAHREGVAPADFRDYLDRFSGGLKGIVAAERQARAMAQGNQRVDRAAEARVALAQGDVLATVGLANVALSEDGYVLLVGRRNASGGIDVVAAAPPHKQTLDMVLRQLAKKR